jgi:hypothetical protein
MAAIVNRVRKTGKGKRDDEMVQGWDSYHQIAMKIARRWLSYYFPSNEDLFQAAALAATVARFGLGEEARMGELTRQLRRVLKQQATAYGMRQRQVRRPDGSKTMQTVRPEIPFGVVVGDLEQEQAGKAQEWYESRMMLAGVGEWTRRQSNRLYDMGR